MKQFFICVIFAILGIVISLGSGWNEGTIIGAWVGVLYAFIASVAVAVVENQIWSKSLKEITPHVLSLIGGAILGAIGYCIF